ncbi:MAG: APC family permease, partial [Thermoleophilaceae bacterium]
MAEYRPKHRGLERVLGTGALFSTAYGNVGSSIYYALGLVAIFALGMTPVVFVIAGLIFACTAATYTEATTMYPEAGGSSSFARRAFNEFWSFFAAWGQMLNYIITVAISAFFVPHYLGVFWAPLGESPADIFGGIAVVAVLAVLNIVGVKESAGLNIFLALADFFTQLLLVVLGLVLVFSPDTLVDNVDLWTSPELSDFLIAIPVGMVAYTGIETISNMAEEARDYGKTIPRGMAGVVVAVFAIYAFLPAVALSALPVQDGETRLALPKEEGGYADDPILGVVENIELGALQGAAEVYVGILAATILFIATNAGMIGVSRLTYSMGQYRQLPERLRALHPRFRTPYVAIVVFGLVACLTILPGQAEF